MSNLFKLFKKYNYFEIIKASVLAATVFVFFILSYPHVANMAATINSSRTSSLTSGLIAYWTFDGKNMVSNVADASGNGNNGSLSGQTSTTTVVGKIGQALKFDGSDDKVSVAGVTPPVSTSFTISVWVYPIPTSDNYGAILSQGSSKGLYYRGIDKKFSYYEGSDHLSSVVNENQWIHYVLVSNGTGVTHYINGVPDLSSVYVVNAVTFNSIGDDAGSETFKGKLDDLRVYSRSLSSSEILALYKLGSGSVQNGTQDSKLTSGLAGLWSFDGAKMVSNVADSSGNGNNGNLSGQTSTTTVAGKIGQALKFDGSDDKVITNKAWSAFLSSSDGTISTWFYAKSLGVGACGTNPRVIIGDTVGYIWIGITNLSNLCVGNYDGGNDEISTAINLNQWYHVTWVHAGGNLSMYLNGTLVNTVPSGNTSSVANNVEIGKGWASNFDGYIDDVHIYNRALSATEVRSLYKLGSGSAQNTTQDSKLTSGLVGLWSFDGPKMLSNVADSSGNGYTGRILGQTSTSTVSGRIGQGLFLDGTNDNVKILTDIGDNTSTLTVSAWIKPLVADIGSGETYVTKSRASASVAGTWALGRNSGQNFSFNVVRQDSIGNAAYSASGYTDTKWHHVVGVYDGTNITVYTDGIAGTPVAHAGSLPDSAPYFLCFGSENGDSGGNCDAKTNSGASYDDVRLYNRVLSASEIQTLYKLGK